MPLDSVQFVWQRIDDSRAGTFWEQLRLPPAAARAKIDVLFAPAYTAPLRIHCPTVLAIHDLSYFAQPKWFSMREGLRRRWVTKRAARRAHAVIAGTAFAAREIDRFLGLSSERVHIVPYGSTAPTADGDASARELLVLFVGSLFNRRRIPELLAGFAATAARVPSSRLVLAGDNRTEPRIDPIAIATRLGIADRVTWTGYVTDDELDALYRRARVFVFLSDYEGFGMTPLEAIAHGVPPVLLDTDVMREVYGDAASYVSLDPSSIADTLERLLTDDDAQREALARACRRLEMYSWDRAAETTIRIIEQAAGR